MKNRMVALQTPNSSALPMNMNIAMGSAPALGCAARRLAERNEKVHLAVCSARAPNTAGAGAYALHRAMFMVPIRFKNEKTFSINSRWEGRHAADSNIQRRRHAVPSKDSSSWPVRFLVLLVLLMTTAPLTSVSAPLLAVETRLTATDLAPAEIFGASVAIQGEAIFVGAVLDDEKGQDAGSVYVFARTSAGWSLQQKLAASDASANDHFGRAIAIDGNTLVVGASEADTSPASLAGAAYVFVWDGMHWNEQAKLVASDVQVGKEFGNSVAVSGDTVVVGAPKDKTHGPASGAIYVFARNGTTWSQQAKLTAGDGSEGSGLGSAVGISRDTVVAGAAGVLPQFSGHTPAAYVFVRAGTSWNQEAKLTDNPIATAFHSAFGEAVAISGDTIVVGDKFDDGRAMDAGAAIVFVRDGTTWSLQQKLNANDGSAGDLFGSSIAIDGDTFVAGAPLEADSGTAAGAAYFFRRSGKEWTQAQKLNASNAGAGDNFASSLAVNANRVVVGAPFKDASAGADFGAAYVYEREPLPVLVVTATDPSTTEGASALGTFLIGRLGSKTEPLTVHYALGGTATNGGDFQTVANSATIPAGAAWVQITVAPIEDAEVESSETVVLTLAPSAAYTVGTPNSATVTIVDNDQPAPPPLVVTTVTVDTTDPSASESGLDSGTFRIDRFGDPSSPLTVIFSLLGTATNGGDYQRLENSVTFPAGKSFMEIKVQPIDDAQEEGSETVILALNPSAGYSVGARSSATITIEDNDQTPSSPPPSKPTVTVRATDPDAAEGRPDVGVFTIDRSGDPSAPLTVFLNAPQGTATNGRDYQRLADSIAIPAGASSANVIVQPIDDTELEDSETVVLTLASSSAYTIGSPDTATITIVDSHRLAPTSPALVLETKLVVGSSLPVTLSGDTLALGGHVFRRTSTAWVEQQTLVNGSAAALDGDTLAIGASETTIYVRNGTSWSAQQTLPVQASSLALSGDILVIGTENDNTRGASAGAVSVFVRSGAAWSQQAKLTASDGLAGAALGYSVAVSADTLVAGAPGRTPDFAGQIPAAYVFVRNGTSWSQQAKLVGNPNETGPGNHFGVSVGISGDSIVVGDPNDNGRGQDAGAAFVFLRNGGSWTRQQILTASDGSAGDLFGWSIAMKGENLVAGAPRDSIDRGSNAGSAYVFGREGTTWAQLQKLTASDAAAGNNFGTPVAIDTDTVAVGSYGGLFNNSSNPATVYVYEAPRNTAPTITCPAPTTLSCSPPGGMQATVSVQVSDADGDGLAITWIVDGASAQTNSVPSSRPPRPADLSLTRLFTLGSHPVRITVSDGRASVTCETVVTIAADNTPPAIQCPADIVVTASPGQSSAVVQFKVLATDNCSSVTVVSNPRSGSAFPIGTTTVACSASDASGNQSTCSFKVTVTNGQPPAQPPPPPPALPPDLVTLRANPSVLWPPNHKMVRVTINVNAGDKYVLSSFRIVGVKSNEPATNSANEEKEDKSDGRNQGSSKNDKNDSHSNGKGKGKGKDSPDDDGDNSDTSKKGPGKNEKNPDWEITGPLQLNLRAERLGTGRGRVYTITVEFQDKAGNRITKEVTVSVPLNMSPTRRGLRSDGSEHAS